MISILDIDHHHSLELAEFIKLINDDFKITFNESELLKSSKIIISFSGSISKAIRKIHLMNLFSALRMISDKPILGINCGFQIMCEYIDNVACLGMLPEKIGSNIDFKETQLKKNFFEISQIKKEPLFEGIDDDNSFYFDQILYLPKNSYTTSVFKNNPEISSSVRKDNFCGVQFLPQKSGQNGMKFLRNFIEL